MERACNLETDIPITEKPASRNSVPDKPPRVERRTQSPDAGTLARVRFIMCRASGGVAALTTGYRL